MDHSLNNHLMVFAWLNFSILTVIGAVHVFWAFGGKWGASAAIPELEGKALFKPGPVPTLLVAFFAFVMSLIHLNKAGVFTLNLPQELVRNALFIISAIFMFRAVGDFRYVGFFKRVKDSVFAKLDTCYYSPLCAVIALNAFLSAIIDIK